MPKYNGVQVYEILPDGCLNGTYANEGSRNEIYNEIARKKRTQPKDAINKADNVIGDYDCFYFDLDNERVNCDLIIRPGANTQYTFTWIDGIKTLFTGVGWKTNNHQITIAYK